MAETNHSRSVIAIDPGRSKCGIAFVSINGEAVVERSIVPTDRLVVSISRLLREKPLVSTIVIGSGTGSSTLARALRETFPTTELILVDEVGTSLLARQRYLDENPLRGWRGLLPRGLQIPQEPYDDYAALILAERYLAAGH